MAYIFKVSKRCIFLQNPSSLDLTSLGSVSSHSYTANCALGQLCELKPRPKSWRKCSNRYNPRFSGPVAKWPLMVWIFKVLLQYFTVSAISLFIFAGKPCGVCSDNSDHICSLCTQLNFKSQIIIFSPSDIFQTSLFALILITYKVKIIYTTSTCENQKHNFLSLQ